MHQFQEEIGHEYAVGDMLESRDSDIPALFLDMSACLDVVEEVYLCAPVPRGNWTRVCCWGHA